LEGKGDEGFGKKEETSGRNRGHWEGRALRGSFFFLFNMDILFRAICECRNKFLSM